MHPATYPLLCEWPQILETKLRGQWDPCVPYLWYVSVTDSRKKKLQENTCFVQLWENAVNIWGTQQYNHQLLSPHLESFVSPWRKCPWRAAHCRRTLKSYLGSHHLLTVDCLHTAVCFFLININQNVPEQTTLYDFLPDLCKLPPQHHVKFKHEAHQSQEFSPSFHNVLKSPPKWKMCILFYT